MIFLLLHMLSFGLSRRMGRMYLQKHSEESKNIRRILTTHLKNKCSTSKVTNPITIPIPNKMKTPATADKPKGRGWAISCANLKHGSPPYHFSCRMSMYPFEEYFAITAEILSCKSILVLFPVCSWTGKKSQFSIWSK